MMRFLQTLASQPSATSSRKSGLIVDLQLRERELKSLKGTIITNDTPGFKQLVDTLDCILIDGLKDMRAAYWPVMHPLLCKSTLTELCSLQRVKTSLGRSRAWLFRGFSDQLLFSYLNCLLEDRSTIEHFYCRDAILHNKTNLLEVVTIVGAIEREAYTFQLQTDCAYFDNVNWLRNEALENDAEVARDASESVDLTEEVDIRCETLDQRVTYHSEDHNQESDSVSRPSATAKFTRASGTTDAPSSSQNGSVAKLDSHWLNELDRKEHRTYSDPPTSATLLLDSLKPAEHLHDSAAPLHHRTASQTDCITSNRPPTSASEWGGTELELGAANRDGVSITSSDNFSSVDESADASNACVTTVKSRVRGVRNRKRVEADHVDTRSSTPSSVLAPQSELFVDEQPADTSHEAPPNSEDYKHVLEPSSTLTLGSSDAADALPESESAVESDAAIPVEQMDANKSEATDVNGCVTDAEKEVEPLAAASTQKENDGDETMCNSIEPQPSFLHASGSDKCAGTKPRDTSSYATELPHEAKLFLELSVFAQNERCERVFNVLSSFMDGDVQPSWLVFTNRHVMNVDKMHRGVPVDFSNQRNITFSSLPLTDVQCVNSGLHEQWLSIVTKRRRVALMLDTASRSLTAAVASTLLSLQSSAQCYSDASVYELVLRKHACRDCDCLSLSSHDPATAQCRIISSHLCFLTQLNATSPNMRTNLHEQTDAKLSKRGSLEWRKFYVDANQAADVRSGGSSMWNAMAYSHAIMQGALETVRSNPAQLVRSLKSGLTGTLSGLRRLAGAGAERMRGPKSDSSRNSQHSDASSDTSDFTLVEQDWNCGHFVLEDGILSQFASESAAQCDFSYSVAEHCIGCQIGTHADDADFEGEAACTNTKMTCLLLFREEAGMLVDATHNNGQVVCLEIRIAGSYSDAIRDWHAACCRTVLAGQSGLLTTGQRAAKNVQRNATACALLLAAHCDGALRMHFVRGNRVLHDYRSLCVVDLNDKSVETALLVVGNDHLVINQSSSEETTENPLSIVSFIDSAELTKLVETIHEFEPTKPNDRLLNVSCLERVNQDTLADIHPALTLETINLINEHLKKYVTVP